MVFKKSIWFFFNVKIWMSAYRKKRGFPILQKQELIEKNEGHFWIQRARITTKKMVVYPAEKCLLTSVIYNKYVVKFQNTFNHIYLYYPLQ